MRVAYQIVSMALLGFAVSTESKPLLIFWHSFTALQSSLWAYMLWKRTGLVFLSAGLMTSAVAFGFYAVYIYLNHHGRIPGWSWPIGLALSGQIIIIFLTLLLERRYNRDKVDMLRAAAKSYTFLSFISGTFIPLLRGNPKI